MRKEVEELNNAFDRFIERVNEDAYGFDTKRRKEYQNLMVRAFALLQRDWNGDMVPKDVSLFLTTLGQFVGRDDGEGNTLGSEEYERVATFHYLFITSLFANECIRLDKGGLLSIESFDNVVLKIDPRTFELPTLDEIYGI